MTRGRRRSSSDRGPITWVEKPATPPAPFMRDIATYSDAGATPEEFNQYLHPGALWVATRGMQVDARDSDSQYTVLEYAYVPGRTAVPLGTPLIYTGEVRAERRLTNGRTVNVPLHSFIALGTRYVINDFACIVPLAIHARRTAERAA